MQTKKKIIFIASGIILISFVFYGGFYCGFSLLKKFIQNPTYQELMAFLEKDKTNEKKQVDFQYDPIDFARELKENANKAGIRTAVVPLYLQSLVYYINAFETKDKGLIYVDPQKDKIVTVQTEKRYWEQNGWALPNIDDRIVKVYDPIW